MGACELFCPCPQRQCSPDHISPFWGVRGWLRGAPGPRGNACLRSPSMLAVVSLAPSHAPPSPLLSPLSRFHHQPGGPARPAPVRPAPAGRGEDLLAQGKGERRKRYPRAARPPLSLPHTPAPLLLSPFIPRSATSSRTATTRSSRSSRRSSPGTSTCRPTGRRRSLQPSPSATCAAGTALGGPRTPPPPPWPPRRAAWTRSSPPSPAAGRAGCR